MAISAPITVNGFPCNNCSDVALAARHIDPAGASSGPYGVNGESPEQRATKNHFSPEARSRDRLEELHQQARAQAANPYAAAGMGAAPGQLVDRTA